MGAKNYKETKVYKLAFEPAMDVFETSKTFPREETYSLRDQVRRSSRSVCANLAEAYRKKRYRAHFISKITDSGSESSEASVWFDFSMACKYISQQKYDELIKRNEAIGKLLNHMINNHDKY
jgi:four helix bundle protein